MKLDYLLPEHIYAVTNKHIARRGYPVIRLNTIDGKADVLELDHNDWIPHPDGDDLAVAPIDLPQDKHHYHAIGTHLFVTQPRSFSYLGAGDDTFMVGRFVSHAGKQRNTPSLRFGNIAMLPFEKVKLSEAANCHMQEAFLVETRSISGFSGSPVFVYKPEMKKVSELVNGPMSYLEGSSYESVIRGLGETKSVTRLVGELMLLGIDCGHVPSYKKVINGAGTPHPQGWKVESNTGMAIVIPAWRLQDLLSIPELEMQRKRKDEQYKKEQEDEESAVADSEESGFTKESYQDALMRASRKISEPESKDSETSE